MQQIFLCGVTNDFEVTTQETDITNIDIYKVNENFQYDIEGLYSFKTHLDLIEWLSSCVNALADYLEIDEVSDEDISEGLTTKPLSLLVSLYKLASANKKIKLCDSLIDVVFEGIICYSNHNFTTLHDLMIFLISCVNLMKSIAGTEVSLQLA